MSEPTGPERAAGRARQRLATQILITVVAVGAAAAHLIWPDLEVDAVTLGLLAIAALPWLGALFKEIRVPGLVEAVYRDVQELRQHSAQNERVIEKLSDRVSSVEAVIGFSGAATDDQKDVLTATLKSYLAYLESLGVSLGPVPTIHIEPDAMVAYPEPAKNRLFVGEQMARPDIVLHEYSHWVLEDVAGVPRNTWSADAHAIETGLAYYLPCSFASDPKSGFLNIANSAGSSPSYLDPAHRAGLQWAGALWGARTSIGRHRLDRPLIDAWRATPPSGSPAGFVDQVASALAASDAAVVRAVIPPRNLP